MLYITALPIDGDWKTLDPRVISRVREADLLVAEERKNALRLLAACDTRDKEFILINEHSDDEERLNAARRIAACNNSVFVSDAGTPCIADPDWRLVRLCLDMGVEIKSVPGASSTTAALSVSGFDCTKYAFLGFPPREKKERAAFFKALETYKMTVIFLERPYALTQTLEDLSAVRRELCVCLSLGTGEERTLRGKAQALLPRAKGIKEPFCIVINKD